MADQLDKAVIAKAYARWAPIYDFVFGAVFERGRKAAVAAAEQIGGRILEVGVGTGLSLPDYSSANRLVGVDLSAPMLRKAKARVAERRLGNVNGLAVMDAQRLAFAEAAFDVVVAQYVITAVPDPEATLDEFVRVIKPGGEIVDLDGRVLGCHDGIIHFTVGQRRGLGVATGSPLYVVRLDAALRRVVVGPREALRISCIRLRDVNWLGDRPIDQAIGDGREIYVKVRSTRRPQAAWLHRGDDGFAVELIGGEDGVSPGQACVFYEAPQGQGRVLGGGIIAGTVALTHALGAAVAALAGVR